VMSHCVAKHARRSQRKIVLLSCHYDVIEWLNPDWVIDCNEQKFVDRRLLHPSDRQRKESLDFEMREASRDTWKSFSKYHYLNDKLPGGSIYTFGLFHGPNQIGFQCFANYVPTRKNTTPIYHSNRTIIHPDYAGFGLGLKLIDVSSAFMKKTYGYRIMAKFSSLPIYKSMMKSPCWRLLETKRQIGRMNVGGNIDRKSGYRENIKTFSFEFIG
jgi:hypothetical protein